MQLNMHFKDKDGKHRIVAGDIDLLMDQSALRKMLKEDGLRPSKRPVLGCIRGGLFKAGSRFDVRR